MSLALLRDPETSVRQARAREVDGSRESDVKSLSETPSPATNFNADFAHLLFC